MVKNTFSYSSQTLTTSSVSSPTHLWGYSWGLQPTALQQPRCPQRQPGTPQLPPRAPTTGLGLLSLHRARQQGQAQGVQTPSTSATAPRSRLLSHRMIFIPAGVQGMEPISCGASRKAGTKPADMSASKGQTHNLYLLFQKNSSVSITGSNGSYKILE